MNTAFAKSCGYTGKSPAMLGCSICGAVKIAAHGWCRKHYRRWQRHGDPLKTERPANGESFAFFQDVVLAYQGDDCLTWPYATNNGGYGLVYVDGSMRRVSRLACEAENGPAPTPNHEAAHTCGKGHLACVARRHLSWKTPAENTADKVTHGTLRSGEGSNLAKLTSDDVRQIRALKGKMTQREIGDQFGVSHSNISAIHVGKSWRQEPL